MCLRQISFEIVESYSDITSTGHNIPYSPLRGKY